LKRFLTSLLSLASLGELASLGLASRPEKDYLGSTLK